MPVIEVDNLSKIFGKRSKEALSLLDEGLSKDEILKKTGCTVGVNRAKFQVEAGEVFVIMGLSGSGKSTLVRLLNRLINPTAGDVYVHDDNLSTMNKEELRRVRREKMSMVFQKFDYSRSVPYLKTQYSEWKFKGWIKRNVKRKQQKHLSSLDLEASYINTQASCPVVCNNV